jgi:acyl-CoA reductase-like NAD-dependent aldehyde dehydrogenase
MAAAVENLTPVTLELGGKCPVIIDSDYSIDEAARRVLWGKTFNAGQTCVAPDYVLIPRGQAKEFSDSIAHHYRAHFPKGAAEASYTSIINTRQYQRLRGLVDDSRWLGANVIELEPHGVAYAEKRKFPLTLVINPPASSKIMQEEVFGPILPIIEHDGLDDAIAMINSGGNPLAIYYCGHSTSAQKHVMSATHSGTAAINEVVVQYLQVDMPFGGVGGSGNGRYHGPEGFETFSHMKPVFRQRGFGSFTGLKLLYPPYTGFTSRLISMMGG